MRGWTSAALATVVTLGAANSAAAQERFRGYAGASIGSFRVSADAVEGSSLAAGGFAGVRLLPWLDLEGEIALPSSDFTRSYGGDALSLSFAGPGASPAERERMGIWLRYDKRRDIAASFSGVVVFHPVSTSRVTPGAILGITAYRARERTDYTPVRVGEGVDPGNQYARPHAETWTRTLGGITVGANLAIAITPRLAVVPDLRYDYGSIGDEINNSLRTTVRVLWRF